MAGAGTGACARLDRFWAALHPKRKATRLKLHKSLAFSEYGPQIADLISHSPDDNTQILMARHKQGQP
jgi:hypothetical protein